MKQTLHGNQLPIMTIARFFSPNEHFHVQLSTDYSNYVGILHKHEYIEVVYILSGNATHVIEDRSYDVKRGDLYIVNVNTAHKFCVSDNEAEPFVAYDLMFTPEFFDRALAGNYTLESLGDSYMFRSLSKDTHESIGVSDSIFSMFSDLFKKMHTEYINRETGYMEIIRAYLMQVLITAIRIQNRQKNRISRNKEQSVHTVVNFIEEHYAGTISMQELADLVFLSPDYLGKIFREITGESISARIQRIRLRHACYMLTATDKTVANIALECGFSDTKFFYNVFKKYMGVSPGEYRNQTTVRG